MTTYSLIGDSQAEGVTNVARPSLPARITAKGGTPRRFWFRVGASTTRLIEDLDEVLTPVPDVMIVMAGGNDTRYSTGSWGTMLDRLHHAGVRQVVWIGPPNSPDPETDANRRAISDAQRAFFSTRDGVRWLSGRELASGLPHADGRGVADVHLTRDGYSVYAQRIASALTSSGGMLALGAAVAAGLLWFAWSAADRATYGSRRRRR